ncbi:MAG: transposase [Elainellaceae cyanobacterium]
MLDTQEECIALLEQLRWSGQPRCPYCDSTNAAPLRRERRYHCNNCFTSYSVTVGTLFHKTHVELPKWFQAIKILISQNRKVSIRQLAAEIGVNKNTASYMLIRFRKASYADLDLLNQLVKILENSAS